MPGVDAHLHYRNIDVSTLKELVGRWYPEAPPPPPKQETHRALDDIRESIAELKWYRENFFVDRHSGGTIDHLRNVAADDTLFARVPFIGLHQTLPVAFLRPVS